MKGTESMTSITRPSLWNLVGEVRWVGEWIAGALWNGHDALPEGDGHGVLLLPGFLASDRSLAPLARVLRRLGYRTYRSGLNPNTGPTQATVEWLRARVVDVMERVDGPISIVGQSLGGIYAREIARAYPDGMRAVITLGSPFRAPDDTHASKVAAAMSSWWDEEERERRRGLHKPLRVPTTSIFSKSDGIVPWKACLELPGPRRENIEVATSHIGMSVHPEVIGIVADRLALSPGSWRPYRAARGRAGNA